MNRLKHLTVSHDKDYYEGAHQRGCILDRFIGLVPAALGRLGDFISSSGSSFLFSFVSGTGQSMFFLRLGFECAIKMIVFNFSVASFTNTVMNEPTCSAKSFIACFSNNWF